MSVASPLHSIVEDIVNDDRKIQAQKRESNLIIGMKCVKQIHVPEQAGSSSLDFGLGFLRDTYQ